MAGYVCHAHFGTFPTLPREEQDALEAACSDCQAAKEAARDRMQRQDTIDPEQQIGAHIALVCINHPDATYSTKNLECIGARHIFSTGTITCTCPISDLRVDSRRKEPIRT